MPEIDEVETPQPEILFEDNHLLVVDKPPGLLTQPSGTEQGSLEAVCKAWLKAKYKKPGNVFLHAVHRLDKPVGGIVVFAKTSKALVRLNASMRAKEAVKTYLAKVEGVLPSAEGTLEHYLLHEDHRASVSSKDDPLAKEARLHYKVVDTGKDTSLVEIQLETGRYHQIRLQLSAAGCPIAGDVKYGSRKRLPGGIIALKHCRLIMPHPVTGKQMVFEAKPSKGLSVH